MRKIALIIGLEYFDSYKLNGCYNDAKNVIKTIKKVYNFTNDEIIFLDDKEKGRGSKETILKCFDYISSNNYDFIYFYYAGHGSYTNDKNNDEGRLDNSELMKLNSLNKDSYLVTSEKYNRIGMIKDDEIKDFLKKLNSNTNFFGMIDCCHSGTMFDCNYIYLPKKINKQKVKHSRISYLIKNCEKEYNLLNSKYNTKNSIQANVILLSGARDKQYSYEGLHEGSYQGNFTYYMCKLFKNMNKKNEYLDFQTILLTISGLINDSVQVPVCTSSKSIDLKNSYPFDKTTSCINLFECEYKKESISNDNNQKKSNNSWFGFFSREDYLKTQAYLINQSCKKNNKKK